MRKLSAGILVLVLAALIGQICFADHPDEFSDRGDFTAPYKMD